MKQNIKKLTYACLLATGIILWLLGQEKIQGSFFNTLFPQLGWAIVLFTFLIGMIYLFFYAKLWLKSSQSFEGQQDYQLLQVREELAQQRLAEAKLTLQELDDTCEELKAELNRKNRQMTSHALHMLQKNQVLVQMTQLLSQARQQKGSEATRRVLKRLENLVDYGINLDKDWDQFQQVFEQVHPQFYQDLKTRFPALTRQDMRLCALLKLNLSNKEMATLLNISPHSVNMKRYRLRKKMGE